MGSRALYNLSKSIGPGPSKYEIPSKVVEHPGISMATRPKRDILNATIDIPGPGTYSPEKKPAKISFS